MLHNCRTRTRTYSYTHGIFTIDAIDGEFNAVRLQAYKGKKSILVATHYKLCRGERVGAAPRPALRPADKPRVRVKDSLSLYVFYGIYRCDRVSRGVRQAYSIYMRSK